MVRKLFIVAQGNAAVYRQLHVTVGREPDVEIIYDRRPVRLKPGAVARLVRPLKRLVSRRENAYVLEHLDRRQQQAINEEIARKGFAVVRVEHSAPPGSPSRSGSRARLVVEPGDAPASNLRSQHQPEEKGSVTSACEAVKPFPP